MLFTQFQVNFIDLSVQKKRKIDFQDGRHGGHLGFRICTFFAIYDLQVTVMLLTKRPRRPSRISGRRDFSYLWYTSYPNAAYQVSSQLAFRLGEKEKNKFSRWRLLAIMDLWSERF